MKTYIKKFHNKHIYLQIYEGEISKLKPEDFNNISNKYNKPLQIGVESDNYKLISLLEKSGFVLKRKCYEIEASKDDLKNPIGGSWASLHESHIGEKEYEISCQMVYDYYWQTHYDINPLTASFKDFMASLPKDGLYTKSGGEITACALIEDNEIAYLACNDKNLSREFLESLLAYMFDRYEFIFFEADDTDPLASKLKEPFRIGDIATYDTYVKTS